MSVEQKRADLEKALAALDESEIEAVAGGLSEKGKKIMTGVAIGAGVIAGLGTGYGLYKHFKGKKEEVPTIDHSKPIYGSGYGNVANLPSKDYVAPEDSGLAYGGDENGR